MGKAGLPTDEDNPAFFVREGERLLFVSVHGIRVQRLWVHLTNLNS